MSRFSVLAPIDEEEGPEVAEPEPPAQRTAADISAEPTVSEMQAVHAKMPSLTRTKSLRASHAPPTPSGAAPLLLTDALLPFPVLPPSIVEVTHDTIFVSLASYRDPECSNTLYDLFTKAHYPERVYVGVCQQNAPEDADCLDDRLKPYLHHLRVLRLSHFDAQGPMYARALIEQQLYRDELFYLQIDSHMLFVPGWDELCIQQLALCPSDRPILTTYPNDFDRLTRQHVILPDGSKRPLGTVPPTFIRFREFHQRLKFTEQEKHNFHTVPLRPLPSLFWAAGFSFSLGELIRQVPYDPHCPFLFLGEEMGLALRYFTHGWDFFAPGVNVVYHLLKRTYRKTFWEQVYLKNCVVDDATRRARKTLEEQAVHRATQLVLDRLPPSDPYGLGKVRTVRDWEVYTGVDIRAQTAQLRSYWGLSPQAPDDEKLLKHGQQVPSFVPKAAKAHLSVRSTTRTAIARPPNTRTAARAASNRSAMARTAQIASTRTPITRTPNTRIASTRTPLTRTAQIASTRTTARIASARTNVQNTPKPRPPPVYFSNKGLY